MSSPTVQVPPPVGATVSLHIAPRQRQGRLVGVDVARGLAVIGMIATHTLPLASEAGSPTTVTVIAAGRAAAMFVFLAGVSVAFLSGGSRGVRGRERAAASSGLLVRAVAVLVLGLALGLLAPWNGIWGILPFYGLMFLVAIPLLGLRPRGLGWVTAVVFVLGPVLLVATAGSNLPYAGGDDPTFGTLVSDPLGVLVQLLMSGAYPVVVYLGYLTAGLAVGRLDLSSRRVAWWLLGGGLALAAAARAVSWFVLYPLGGLARLMQDGSGSDDPAPMATRLLWEEHQSLSTWWHLALPAPHSHTPIDLLHTLGSAGAVLGAALLITRLPVMRRLLAPLAAVGSLALTLYCAHLVVLATGVWSDQPAALFTAMLVGAVALAVVWQRWIGQGPLEKVVSAAASASRRAVAGRAAREASPNPPHPTAGPRPPAGIRVAAGAITLAVLVVALGLGLWTRTQLVEPAAEGEPRSQSGREAPPGADTPGPLVPQASTPGGPVTADTARYCALSEHYAALTDTDGELTPALLDEATAILEEMRRSAPAGIDDAVAVLAQDRRAEPETGAVVASDSSSVESAQVTVDEFDARNCS